MSVLKPARPAQARASFRLLSCGLLAVILSACGGGGGGGGSDVPPPPPPPVTDPAGIDKTLLRQQVDAFVAEQKARIETIDCKQSQTGPCEPIRNIRFSDGQAVPAKLRADQTVLLIDEGPFFSAMLRYRSRMLAYYRVNESTGLVEPHDPVIAQAPRWGVELLRAIDGFQYRDSAGQQRPSFVPADWLRPLAPLVGVRSFVGPEWSGFHGASVLSMVVEASPQAGFVLLDPFPFEAVLKANRSSACAKDRAALEQGVQRTAQSLQAVLQRHGVDYVNLSGGVDVPNLIRMWDRLGCGSALSSDEARALMLAYRPLFAALFESPTVLGVQAAGQHMAPHNAPLDMLALSHRVRVQYFNARATRLSADGVTGAQRPAVHEPWAHDRAWVDVFLNTGLLSDDLPLQINERPPLKADNHFGLRLGPSGDVVAPSFAAPQALNRLIHLKQQLAPTMAPEASLDAALIQRMKDALTPPGCSWAPEDGGRCKLQDPAWHRQQELFRQGWLPADWRWE